MLKINHSRLRSVLFIIVLIFSLFGSHGQAIAKTTSQLFLTPVTATKTVGETEMLTVQLINVLNPAGKTVTFTVTGADAQTDVGTVDATGKATFMYTGTIAGTDTVVATGITTNPPGSLPSNSSTIIWNTPQALADLAIKLDVDRRLVHPNRNNVFTMTVENRGQATALDVTFSINVPDPLNPVDFFCVPPASLATINGQTSCQVEELAPGEFVTGIAVLMSIPNPAPDEFMVSASVDSATPDANEANNVDQIRLRLLQSDLDRPDLVPVIPPIGGGDFCVPVGDPPRFGIAFTVRNTGMQDAPVSDAIVEFFLQNGAVARVDVPIDPIAAGASFDPPPVATPPGCFDAGADCVFSITVDATQRVNEFIEVNNTTRGRCVS